MNHCYYCGHGIKQSSQGYFNRIKTLKKWVYSKSLNKYEMLLLELSILLQNLLPQERVKVKDVALDDQIKKRLEEKKLEVIYELLTYGICLLNQQYRLYEDGYWIAEKEDQLIALSLLQPKLCPETMLVTKTRKIYLQLIEVFYPRDFTKLEATKGLLIAKSTLNKHMMAMENCGYIEQVGGDKKNGYRYNIAHWPWKK